GPLLSVVKFQLAGLETRTDNDLMLIGKANLQVDDILSRLRTICHHLMPQVLIRKGFVSAIDEYLADLEATTSMHIAFRVNQQIRLPDASEIHLYRMIQ